MRTDLDSLLPVPEDSAQLDIDIDFEQLATWYRAPAIYSQLVWISQMRSASNAAFFARGFRSLGQSENSVGKPRSRAFRIQSNLDLSPNITDSPVVVLDTIGAEVDFFQLNALFSPFLAHPRHIHHPDHGRQPQVSRPKAKPHHHHPPSQMSPQLASVEAALIQWPQRLQSPPRLPTSEPMMARGDILPPSGRTGGANKTHKHKNNTKDTTINRNVGGVRGVE
eukprot:scaffold149040_cov62-Cyclotella_meneghiniana.AAC.6